jgi:hypothetical protein
VLQEEGSTYGSRMVYILIGGPRSRQLVDELPSGYRADGRESDSASVVVLEDLVAAPAVWDIPEES